LGTAPSFTCETVQFTQVEGNDGLVLLAGPLSFRTRAGDGNDVLLMKDIVSAAFAYAPRQCQSYHSLEDDSGFKYELDHKTRTVLAFSILAPMLGAALIIKAFFASMCADHRGWKCVGAGFLLTSIFQGLCLLIETSSLCLDNPAFQYLDATNNTELASTFPESCEWAIGFNVQIAAVALWALAGFTAVLIKDSVVMHEPPTQEQAVTYRKKSDGTVEEVHVTVVTVAPVEQ
jgi:hypothetical protein